MEFDVWYSCHNCDFGTHVIKDMREHVKNEHGVKPKTSEDLVWHVANEWADGLCNAFVWMMNVQDGTSNIETALEAIQSDIKHARKVSEETKLKIKGMKDGC